MRWRPSNAQPLTPPLSLTSAARTPRALAVSAARNVRPTSLFAPWTRARKLSIARAAFPSARRAARCGAPSACATSVEETIPQLPCRVGATCVINPDCCESPG